MKMVRENYSESFFQITSKLSLKSSVTLYYIFLNKNHGFYFLWEFFVQFLTKGDITKRQLVWFLKSLNSLFPKSNLLIFLCSSDASNRFWQIMRDIKLKSFCKKEQTMSQNLSCCRTYRRKNWCKVRTKWCDGLE